MPHLTLNLLGTFQATLDSTPVVGFESDKERALLAYLAVESDRPQRRETLAGLLWPDMAERDARANLRHVLAHLRKVLDERESECPFLLVTRQTIQFNNASDCQLDVRAFTNLMSTTSTHVHTSLEDCVECITCLCEAAELYQGEFLAGFSLDSDLFEEWMVVQREKLHIQVLDVLDHLTAYHEKKGNYNTAQRYAQDQVELEPWRESAHRQMMRAYALSGQRGMALAQYETCKRVLQRELGIEPEQETTFLYEQIQRGELQPETPERIPQPSPQPVAPPNIPHNLPTALTPFVGREELLNEIAAHLKDPDCRLLTLLGPGGSGKTRLALEATRMLMDDDGQHEYTHGIYFVPLVAVENVESVVPAVAQAMGFSFYGEGEPQAQLLGYLRRKQILLVLDNYEQLVKDVGFIIEILRTAPDVKLLVTSRIKLNLPAEGVIPVPGMTYPASMTDLDDVGRHSAVKLFVQCARRVQSDFVLDAGNAADVVRVCKQVHGMPLGILLATAWLNMLKPAEIADEIERSLDFLAMDWQEVPARQRSMRAVFDYSWGLLGEREREILCGLSVFQGACTREAVQAVTGASLRDLLGLINKSQLHRTSDGRYEMHELLRQYAAQRLAGEPENRRMVRNCHCAFYAENLIRWEGDLKGPQQHQATLEIASEMENVRAAIDWMLEHSKIEWLNYAIDVLGRFYSNRNRYQEGAALCQTIAETVKKLTSADVQRLRAKVLAWQSYLTEQTGNIKSAVKIIEESLSILGLSAVMNGDFDDLVAPLSEVDQRLRAFVFWAAGYCLIHKDFVKTRWLFEQSLALYRSLGDQWSVARLLDILATTLYEEEQYNMAEPMYRECLSIAQSLGDIKTIIACYQILGLILLVKGRIEEGEKLMHMALTNDEETGVGLSIVGHLLKHLIKLRQGKFVQALSDIQAEIARYEDVKAGVRDVEGKLHLSTCYRHLGSYKKAYTLVETGLAQCIKAGYTNRSAACYLQMGQISLARRHYKDAQRWLEQSTMISRKTGANQDYATWFGYATRGLGQLQHARYLLLRSLQATVRQRYWFDMLDELPGVALLLSDLGQHERAVELYALACQHPYVANSRWFEDVAGKHIAKAAESLPPDVVEAAQERGRARDLWETAEELLTVLGENNATLMS